MGGLGSGRRARGPVVEDGLTLDINKLVRDGLIGLGNRVCSLTWTKTRTGDYVASVGFFLEVWGPNEVDLLPKNCTSEK